jgi:hypothetical protein
VDARGTGYAARGTGGYPGYPRPPSRQVRFRRAVFAVVLLSVVALVASCLGRSSPAPVPLRLGWAFSPASNTVTIQMTSPAGTAGRQVLAQSRLAVSEHGGGHWSAGGATIQVPVPAGSRTSLLVQLTGPQPLTRTLTVTAPPALRIVASGASSGRWLMYASVPLRPGPPQALCGTDTVRLPASGYWKAFVAAGGLIGDHTVSHPYLTKLTLDRATTQWRQARTALGRWLGQSPVMGRPPYGAFDRTVEVAAARAGLTALAGWSASMSGNRIETWNGKPLGPGEIVILHWVPGLGQQLAALLTAIRALHLNPTPLTPASFAGIAPQHKALNGD